MVVDNHAVRSFKVMQQEYHHEVATIDLIDTKQSLQWPSGTPVMLSWGEYPLGSCQMYGYVNHWEHDTLTLPRSTTTCVLVGATMPMKNEYMRNWGTVTGSYVAGVIARRYRFFPVIDKSTFLFENLMQSAERDFSFLVRLAKEIGYRFFVQGTTLYFVNSTRVIEQPGQLLPVVTSDFPHASLLSFQPTIGEAVPGGRELANHTAMGIDPQTGNVIGQTSQLLQYSAFSAPMIPQLDRFHTTRPLTSLAEVRRVVDAAVEVNRNWVTADAVVVGDARLRPGMAISINGSRLDSSLTGLWLVQGATHEWQVLPPASIPYTTTLRLGRDQVWGSTMAVSPTEWKASVAARTVFQSGLWRSGTVAGV